MGEKNVHSLNPLTWTYSPLSNRQNIPQVMYSRNLHALNCLKIPLLFSRIHHSIQIPTAQTLRFTWILNHSHQPYHHTQYLKNLTFWLTNCQVIMRCVSSDAAKQLYTVYATLDFAFTVLCADCLTPFACFVITNQLHDSDLSAWVSCYYLTAFASCSSQFVAIQFP